MSLKLYFHPLSSFCQKALIAFYENGTPFEPRVVELADEASRAEFLKIWPVGKFPVLRDEARDRTVPESSIIIEYLAQHFPGTTRLVPADADVAWQVRLRDRFYDLYVNVPMQKVVTDRLRPAGQNDAHGVEQARALLATAIGVIDQEDGGEDLGHGRGIHHGRLRRGAGALLRRPGGALRRHPRQRRSLFGAAQGAPLLRPRARGGQALFQAVPAIGGRSPEPNRHLVVLFIRLPRDRQERRPGSRHGALTKDELQNAPEFRYGEGGTSPPKP